MEPAIDVFFNGLAVFDEDHASLWEDAALTTGQAEAFRAYLEGRRDATETAAGLYELASEMKTHDSLESFIYSFFSIIHYASENLFDLQPRLIDLVKALMSLPPVPCPEKAHEGEDDHEDVEWNGDVGMDEFRITLTDKLLGMRPDDENARAVYAFVGRLQSSGIDELRNWSTYSVDCLLWVPDVLEPRRPSRPETEEEETGSVTAPVVAPSRPAPAAVSAISQLFIHGVGPFALSLCHNRELLRNHLPLSLPRWEGWLKRLEELAEDGEMSDLARADARAAVDGMKRAVADVAEGRAASDPSIPSKILKYAYIPGRPASG